MSGSGILIPTALKHAEKAFYARRHARQRHCQGALNAKWNMSFQRKSVKSTFQLRFMKLNRIFGEYLLIKKYHCANILIKLNSYDI